MVVGLFGGRFSLRRRRLHGSLRTCLLQTLFRLPRILASRSATSGDSLNLILKIPLPQLWSRNCTFPVPNCINKYSGNDENRENYPLFRVLSKCMILDQLVPSLCVIRSHKKQIESSPSIIFSQGMVTTKVLPSAHAISNLQK